MTVQQQYTREVEPGTHLENYNNMFNSIGILEQSLEGGTRINPPVYPSISGGTITTDGDYKIHTFTSNGVLTITSIGNHPDVSILIVAGGGNGGNPDDGYANWSAGGGGGGEVLRINDILIPGTYDVSVGDAEEKSYFYGYDASAGKTGLIYNGVGGFPFRSGGDSGSGYLGGTQSSNTQGGGGAGDSENGYNEGSQPGNGGDGSPSDISGSLRYYGGGGGGGQASNISGRAYGGAGGGGAGGLGVGNPPVPSLGYGLDASVNTGGGGGGTSQFSTHTASGGSGIVIIKYRYQ